MAQYCTGSHDFVCGLRKREKKGRTARRSSVLTQRIMTTDNFFYFYDSPECSLFDYEVFWYFDATREF